MPKATAEPFPQRGQARNVRRYRLGRHPRLGLLVTPTSDDLARAVLRLTDDAALYERRSIGALEAAAQYR
jgi:hypothetical protein